MDTCSNCGAEAGELAFCTRCGADLASTGRAAESPTTIVAGPTTEGGAPGDPSGDASSAKQQEGRKDGRRDSRRTIWLTSGIILALVGGIGGFLFFRNAQEANARSSAVAAAAASVSETMTALSGAQSTTEMRAVAAQAKEQQSIVEVNSEVDPSIAAAATALGAIATLETIDGDTLGQWQESRSQIDAAVRSVQIDGTPMDPSSVLSAVDTNVGNAQQALNEWQLKVSVIQETQAERVAELNAYQPSAQAALKSYENLRNSTAKWLADAQRASSISVGSTTTYLQSARDDREDIRDTLVALDPPAELQDVHNEIISSLELGIDGIENLLDGMSALSGCSGTRCTLSRNSGYNAFLSASSTNTARFDRAYEEWQATATGLRAEIEGMQVPTKPVV